MKEIKLDQAALILLIPFSGFYIAGITRYSPLYLALVISACVCFIKIKHKVGIGENHVNFISFYLFILFAIIGLYLSGESPSSSDSMLLYTVFGFTFIFIESMSSIKIDKLTLLFKIFLWITVFLLTGELIIRYEFHRIYYYLVDSSHMRYLQDTDFYRYKNYSIMFEDSNFVGLLALCLFMTACYMKQKTLSCYFFAFILLSLSRSAIISTMFFISCFYLFYINKKLKTLTKIATFTAASLIGVLIIYYQLWNDPSFNTKLSLVSSFYTYLTQTNWFKILFGGTTADVQKRFFTISLHLHFIFFTVKYGLIATLLLAISISVFCYRNRRLIPIVLTYGIVGLSLFSLYPAIIISLLYLSQLTQWNEA